MAVAASLAILPPLALLFGYKELTKSDGQPWDPEKFSTKSKKKNASAGDHPQPQPQPQQPQPQQQHYHHAHGGDAGQQVHVAQPQPRPLSLCAQMHYEDPASHHFLHKNEYMPWDVSRNPTKQVVPGARLARPVPLLERRGDHVGHRCRWPADQLR